MTAATLRILAATIALALSMPLQAQQAPHACATVARAVERLACYDRAFPLPEGVREEAARQAIADFGLERDDERIRNPGQTEEEADPDSVQGKVASIEYHGNGKRSITLEGGQRWMSIEASSGAQMRTGETVTLRKGFMGNYLLTTQGGGILRVRRVR